MSKLKLKKNRFKTNVEIKLDSINVGGEKAMIIGLINMVVPFYDKRLKNNYVELFKEYAKNRALLMELETKRILLLNGLIDFVPDSENFPLCEKFFDSWEYTKNLVYVVQLYTNKKFLMATYGEFAKNEFMYSLTSPDFMPYDVETDVLELEKMYTFFLEKARSKED